MKLYFAGAANPASYKILREYDIDLLVSFYDVQRKGLDYIHRKVFLDSGAFSAFTQNVKIDIDDYIAFIKKYREKIEVYANLDVIDNWEATLKNQKYMEQKGLKPLPVFHYGEPLNLLKKLVKKYDYIGLGGLVPVIHEKKKLKKWLDNCFTIIRNRCKVHGFGIHALWILERYPFFSIDATSWLQPSRFGQITIFKYEGAKTYSKQDKNEFGLKLAKKEHDYLLKKQIENFIHLQRYITKLWEKRGVIWKE